MSRRSKRRSRKPEAFATAKAISSTTQAYQAIKDEILTNRLSPGDPVPIERFVRDLRLSRTPVREAVLQLSREGLIEIRPRMGTFVSHLDLRQIQEMYEVRSLLEGHAARLAAGRIPPDKLAELEQALRSQQTEGEVNCEVISNVGQGVHGLIVSHCGNRVLEQMILSLRDHFTRFRRLSLHIPEKVLSSHQEHLRIIEALRDKNPALAEELVRKHLSHAAQYLLESLLRPSNDHSAPRITLTPGV